MENRIIRPSSKTVWLAYGFAFAALLGGLWLYLNFGADVPPVWLFLLLVLFVYPLRKQLARRLAALRIEDDHLTLETGLLARTRRTIDVAKIQDVTVRQSIGQRLLGTGDLMLESAGERGGIAVRNVDNPRQIADEIVASSKRALRARFGPV